MNLDVSKFFTGLVEFFSILLPGAALTFFLMPIVAPLLLEDTWREHLEGYGVLLFLFASYLVGHLVFLLGAWWLDDLYDHVRRHSLNQQVRQLALHDQRLSWPARALVWMLFKREADAAVRAAARLREQQLAPLAPKDAINTFQWARAWLAAEHPPSLEAVHRFEADSKFFRSFVVVLLLLAVLFALQARWALFTGALVLTPLALWRYADQRLKATNQAYWSVLTLTARAGHAAPLPSRSAPDGITHAGGVVCRRERGKLRYLLVQATQEPDHWVLPKGHREPAEHVRETAVREVHEETGVWAHIEGDLGAVTLVREPQPVRVHFYFMRYGARGRRRDLTRRHVWLPLDEACKKATHIETRELLRRADTLRAHGKYS